MTALRPYPEADALSAPFFAGLQERRLLVQRCRACGSFQLAEYRCWHCAQRALEWVAASGRATVYSFTEIHLPYHPFFSPPYTAAIAELEEGPRIHSTVIGADGLLQVGAELELAFLDEAAGVYPAFRLRAN